VNGLPDDPEKTFANPMFVSPGGGRQGLPSLDGYQLKPGSPCINKAVYIQTGGNTVDFYENSVIETPTDIGVYKKVNPLALDNTSTQVTE